MIIRFLDIKYRKGVVVNENPPFAESGGDHHTQKNNIIDWKALLLIYWLSFNLELRTKWSYMWCKNTYLSRSEELTNHAPDTLVEQLS